MNLKPLVKKKRSLAWLITTPLVLGLGIAVTVLASGYYNSLICTLLGFPRAITKNGSEVVYATDDNIKTKADAVKNAEDITLLTAEEGDILLKNNNKALPLAANSKVSVFGKNSVNLVYGGSGSGGGDTSNAKTIFDSLTSAGFTYNPTLKDFYDSSASESGRPSNPNDLDSGKVVTMAIGETPIASYTDNVKSSYSNYNDAAIVVLSRVGGEGFDLPRTMSGISGAHAADDHYLQLDQNETDLLASVCSSGFKHVVVVINSSEPIECGFLDDPTHYAYQDKIDAALWVGGPGSTGAMAIGEILAGTVNPSGHTVDTFARNFKNDPTFPNFSDNLVENGDRYFYTKDGNKVYQNYYFVDYEEGIYVGYRYYETRGKTDGSEWYSDNVVYPFGYGLSYSTFSWTVKDTPPSSFTATDKITVKVEVKNTSDVAGKDVVQIYAHAPYITDGIEKSDEVLVGFAKTGLLQPNQTEEVEIVVDPYDFASYDYKDKNNNGFKGYELDEGNYELRVCHNAHDVESTIKMSLDKNYQFDKDPTTGNKVENLYTDNESKFDNSDDQLSTVLSRSDWTGTFPTTPIDEERDLGSSTSDKIKKFRSAASNSPLVEDTTIVMPTQGVNNGEKQILLKQLTGKEYDDPLWDQLMDEVSFDDMVKLYNNGAFQTVGIESIGKPKTSDADGPAGYNCFMDTTHATFYDTNVYTSECVIGATWSRDVAQKVGKALGNEGLIGNEKGDGLPYTGWYAPGVNIHRSPFGGRNFEYFSEDGYFAGEMAAAEIEGCKSKGILPTVKHFALNEQETHRSLNGDASFVNEQAMREIFLKPFEKAVKKGKTTSIMFSFNRIGYTWAGGDYRLLTTILREEWGFRGYVICDFNTCAHMDSRQMAYAGGDLNLATTPISWAKADNANDVYVLRKACKNILYSVANSNAIQNDIIGYQLPVWQITLYVIDGVILAGLGVWGFFAIRSAYKKKPEPLTEH